MSLFDLLFLAVFAASVIVSLASVWLALRGRFAGAWRLFRRLLIGAGLYMAVLVVVSLLSPRRVLETDAPQCFDDWCITVAGYRRAPATGGAVWSVALRLSSRARRVSQRENNLRVYLTDAGNRRYDPLPDKAAVPFNVLLQPGESVIAERSFLLPADARDVALVAAHEGGFPIGWFIIGYDTWFRKPALTPLGSPD
jgi:hypothetical protein